MKSIEIRACAKRCKEKVGTYQHIEEDDLKTVAKTLTMQDVADLNAGRKRRTYLALLSLSKGKSALTQLSAAAKADPEADAMIKALCKKLGIEVS